VYKVEETASVSKLAVAVVAAMSSFLTPFISSSVNIALPSISKELSLNAVTLNWVATAYLLAAAAFLVPFGRIADIRGRKKIFLLGIIVDAVSAIFCATSTSGTWLISFQALKGLGNAMIFGTGVAILTSVFPASERGKALGINVAAVYIGLSTGPVVSGLLIEHFGWRSIFFMDAFLAVIIIVVVLWKLKGEWAGARGEQLDYTGSAIYALALVVIMYALSILPARWGFGLIFVGLLALAAFLIWEMKCKFPVLNIGLFRKNTVFAFSNLAALVHYSGTSAVSFLLSLYLQYIKGYTPEHAGLILIAQPIMMVIFSPVAGTLSDRIEPRLVASLGMGLTTTGLALLASVSGSTGLVHIIVSLVILGTGFGIFSSPNTNAVMGSVDRKDYGVASGILGTMRLTGQMISMGISLLLFSLFIGKVEITPEYYPFFLKSMKIALTIAAALCFGGIFASIARGKTHVPAQYPQGL
jgi:EmrB/QacA subfamily drug resistance transporter